MLRILCTILLSVISATHMNPQCCIDVGPIPSFDLVNDRRARVALYSNRGVDQINWFTNTSTHDYTYGGLGHEWKYTEDHRICLRVKTQGTGQAVAAEDICLRAVPVQGNLKLRAVPETTPLGVGEVEKFIIRCDDDREKEMRCVIELASRPVPYRKNLIDLRPLVLDRDSREPSRVNLWPSTGSTAQVFTIVKKA